MSTPIENYGLVNLLFEKSCCGARGCNNPESPNYGILCGNCEIYKL